MLFWYEFQKRMTKCCKTTIKPSEMMNPFMGRSSVRRKSPRSRTKPSRPTNSTAAMRPVMKPPPLVTTSQVVMPPIIRNSPWAKLMMPVSPKISVMPMPIRMMTLATDRLLTSCCRKISIKLSLWRARIASCVSHPEERPRQEPTRRYLWRQPAFARGRPAEPRIRSSRQIREINLRCRRPAVRSAVLRPRIRTCPTCSA